MLRLVLTLLFSSAAAKHKEYCHKDGMHTLTCNYIPKDIPKGITDVRIIDFKEIHNSFIIDTSSFLSSNWENVKVLQFKHSVGEFDSSVDFLPRCFQRLEQLQELHINIMTSISIYNETFTGLDGVKLLNMSGCVRLDLQDLTPSLRGKENLPALETLILSRLTKYREPITVDNKFTETLKDKNITHLDFSDTKISYINITSIVESIQNLQVLNLSFSFIAHASIDYDIDFASMPAELTIDLSHLQIAIYGRMVYYNETAKISNMITNKLHFNLKMINATAIVPDLFSIWIKNCTVDVDEPFPWTTEEFIIRKNGIKSLDVKVLCGNNTLPSLHNIDLAQNGLEFIHPSVFSCSPNLESLDLSMNNLYRMSNKDFLLFEQLLFSLRYLKVVSLSFNNLQLIPEKFFQANGELEEIDLSNNQLKRISFTIPNESRLEVLNLQNNHIKTLDEISYNRLDSVKQENKNLTVRLKSNPISCSVCSSKPFITWLTRTNTFEPDLYCITENGDRLKIRHDNGIKHVQGLCQRQKIMVSASVSSIGATLIVVVTVTVIYKRRKHAIAEANRVRCLRNLAEGQGRYEFVAFLSYSSDDIDFVTKHVTEKMNENLQLMTGIERDLICTGDEYLRPGFAIFDETVRCMERASLVIAIVTNSYCESAFCNNELEQAHLLMKPIIIMLKEQVDENLMTPTMKLLFKSKVRILWETKNDEYVMKTTWKNVCSSMLDLIAEI